jgi:hypothetical protein
MVYLRMRDVVSAGVLAVERFRDVLSGGALPVPVSGEPVSRLALRREFTPSAELPPRLDWEALPDSAAATANLGALLAGLRQAVETVRVDELGRQAWAEVATVRVEHREAQSLSMRRTPDGLVVAADLTVALPRGLAAEISRQINAAL